MTHISLTSGQLIDQLTSEKKILNLELHIFCPDYAPKIRSGLSITVLEKKIKTDSRLKKGTLENYILN